MKYNFVGFTPAQLVSSLQSLAHFHAVGFAMKNVNTIDDLEVKYPFLSTFYPNLSKDKVMVELMDKNFQLFLNDLKESDYEHLVPKFLPLATKTARLLMEATVKEKEFFIHGDLWANNCLFANEPGV